MTTSAAFNCQWQHRSLFICSQSRTRIYKSLMFSNVIMRRMLQKENKETIWRCTHHGQYCPCSLHIQTEIQRLTCFGEKQNKKWHWGSTRTWSKPAETFSSNIQWTLYIAAQYLASKLNPPISFIILCTRNPTVTQRFYIYFFS